MKRWSFYTSLPQAEDGPPWKRVAHGEIGQACYHKRTKDEWLKKAPVRHNMVMILYVLYEYLCNAQHLGP